MIEKPIFFQGTQPLNVPERKTAMIVSNLKDFSFFNDENIVPDDFDNIIYMLAGSKRPMSLHDYDFDKMINACDQKQALKSFFDNPISPQNRPEIYCNCTSCGCYKQRKNQQY